MSNPAAGADGFAENPQEIEAFEDVGPAQAPPCQSGCDACQQGACCGQTAVDEVSDDLVAGPVAVSGDSSESGQPGPASPPRRSIPANTLVIRYGLMRHVGLFRHELTQRPLPGAKAVIRTDRGVEIGQIIGVLAEADSYGSITPERLEQFMAGNGPEYPMFRNGKVLRLANAQDLSEQHHLDASGREEITFCRQQIRAMNLPMRLVTVEHLLGGERIIFYFSADTRVDFRDLVRCLASQYRTRIEMRQVGARDESRLVADYERCGQRCCCQQFLKDLKPVSMRMAKTQKATLDPTKISGRCGRLMCCLRYEDDGYEQLKKRLPRRNQWVRTEQVIGKVIDTQIITQLVRLWLADNTQVVVSNDEIIERDVPVPDLSQPVRREPRPVKDRGERRMLRDEANADSRGVEQVQPAGVAAEAAPAEVASGGSVVESSEPGVQDGSEQEGKFRRRRRKRRKGGQGGGDGQLQASQARGGNGQSTASGGPSGEGQSRKRRRRKKGPRPQAGPGAPSQPAPS